MSRSRLLESRMLGNPQVRFGGGQTKKEQQCHLVGWLPYNTLRKEFPNAFCDSQVRPGQQIGGCAVAPCRLTKKNREDTVSSVEVTV